MVPALRSRESTDFTELQANVSHRKDTEARRAQLSALGGVPGVPPAQVGTHCLDHRTVPESPWAPACWMSRMMVPVPPGPTCSGPLRGGHREPQGSPTLTASQRTH